MGVTASGLAVDTWEGVIVDQILLEAGPDSLDFIELDNHIREFFTWFESWYVSKFVGTERNSADMLFPIGVRMIPRAKAPEGN